MLTPFEGGKHDTPKFERLFDERKRGQCPTRASDDNSAIIERSANNSLVNPHSLDLMMVELDGPPADNAILGDHSAARHRELGEDPYQHPASHTDEGPHSKEELSNRSNVSKRSGRNVTLDEKRAERESEKDQGGQKNRPVDTPLVNHLFSWRQCFVNVTHYPILPRHNRL